MTPAPGHPPTIRLFRGWQQVQPMACEWALVFEDGERTLCRAECDLSTSLLFGRPHSAHAGPIACDVARARVFTTLTVAEPTMHVVDALRSLDPGAALEARDRQRRSGIFELSLRDNGTRQLCLVPEDVQAVWALHYDDARSRLVAVFVPFGRAPHRIGVLELETGSLSTADMAVEHWYPLLFSARHEALLVTRRSGVGLDFVQVDGCTRFSIPTADTAYVRGAALHESGAFAILGGPRHVAVDLDTGRAESLQSCGSYPAFEPRTGAIWAYADSATLVRNHDGSIGTVARLEGEGWRPVDFWYGGRGTVGAPVFTPDGAFAIASFGVSRAKKNAGEPAAIEASLMRQLPFFTPDPLEYHLVDVVFDLRGGAAWPLSRHVGQIRVWVAGSVHAVSTATGSQ